jgi:hypothetical protein
VTPRGIISLATDAFNANASGIVLQSLVPPELFPGPSTYTAVICFNTATNTTYTARVLYGGTIQALGAVPDGTIQGTNSVTGTGFLSISIAGLPPPTADPEIFKIRLDGGGALITGLQVTFK